MNWIQTLARFLSPWSTTLITGRVRNTATARWHGGEARVPTSTEGTPHERSKFGRECRAEVQERGLEGGMTDKWGTCARQQDRVNLNLGGRSPDCHLEVTLAIQAGRLTI